MTPFNPEFLKSRVQPATVAIQGKASKTVVDGKIQSLSVTALAKFNRLEEGCPLRWYLKVVKGWAEPQRSFTDVGDQLHDQLDHYGQTGENVLGKLAMQGFHLLPQPGPRESLKTEWGLNRKPRGKKEGKKVTFFPPEESKLRAAGIPLIGFIDVEDASDDHLLPDGSWIHEPNVVEVIDYKSASSAKWAKPPEKLIETTQMSGYGKFFAGLPEYENISAVRLSQIYFMTKAEPGVPRAFKHSALIPVAIIARNWENAEKVAEQMKSAASERDERKIQPNLDACGAFGGCPHRQNCWAFRETAPIQRLKMQLSKQQSTPTPKEKMSNILLNKVKGLAPNGAPPNGAPQGIHQQPPPPLAKQLTAKDCVAAGTYKFSNGCIGMFLNANQVAGQAPTFSFLQVQANGHTGGEPFPVGADEPVELLTPAAPSVQTTPPPPVQTTPAAPPASPGAPPWAGTPTPTTPPAPKPGILRVPPMPGVDAPPLSQTTTPSGPPAQGEAPVRATLGRGKKTTAPAAPADRAAQVQAALETANGMMGIFGDAPSSVGDVISLAGLLLG